MLQGRAHITSGAERPGPTKRPATWCDRQGAKASPFTGTMGLDMSNEGHSASQVDLPLFEGFPYLLTQLSPAFYHIILLPQDCH